MENSSIFDTGLLNDDDGSRNVMRLLFVVFSQILFHEWVSRLVSKIHPKRFFVPSPVRAAVFIIADVPFGREFSLYFLPFSCTKQITVNAYRRFSGFQLIPGRGI